MTAEGVQRFFEEATAGASQRFGIIGFRVRLNTFPETLVQGNRGVEGAGLRLNSVPCGAQFGGRGYGFKMADDAHRVVEIFRGVFEGKKRVPVDRRSGTGSDIGNIRFRLTNEVFQRGLYMFGGNRIEWDVKCDGQ